MPSSETHPQTTRKRVVITGIGPVSAIGVGQDAFSEALNANATGISTMKQVDPDAFPSHLGAEINDLSVRDYVPKPYRKATKVMARDIEIAVVAGRLAALDAGLTTRDHDATEGAFQINHARSGCHIGAGLIAAETDELARAFASSANDDGTWDLQQWGTQPPGDGAMNNLPPLWLLKYLPNMLACHVTIIHGLEGPSNTITCSEASALLSIGESTRIVERDDADLCFSGGAESKVNQMGIVRFDLAGRMAHPPRDAEPADTIKPFDDDSLGGIVGEGGALAVVESHTHATERGVRIHAEILGFGAAHSLYPYLPNVIPLPEDDTTAKLAQGQSRAIKAALADAGLAPGDIDAVLPLGLGVPATDQAELHALRQHLGDRIDQIPIYTITHLVGDTIAGHGGLAVAAAINILSGTSTLAPVRGNPPTQTPKNILITTHAVGGPNAALILAAPALSESTH